MEDKRAEIISSGELVEIRKTLEETRKSLGQTFRFYIFLNVMLLFMIVTSGIVVTVLSFSFESFNSKFYSVLTILGFLIFSLFLNYIAHTEMMIFSYRSKALQTALIEFSRYQRKLSIHEYEWKLLGDFRIDSSQRWLLGLHTRVFAFFPLLDTVFLLIFLLENLGLYSR